MFRLYLGWISAECAGWRMCKCVGLMHWVGVYTIYVLRVAVLELFVSQACSLVSSSMANLTDKARNLA